VPEHDRRARRRPRWYSGVGGAVLVAAVAGGAIWATGASGTSGFRTADATMATVRQTLVVSGTVVPVHEAAAAFQVAGTVSSVDVKLGQRVTAGQTIASLSTTALAQDVSSAQLSLSSAEARLSENEADEASGTSTGATAGTSSSATAGTSSSAAAGTSSSATTGTSSSATTGTSSGATTGTSSGATAGTASAITHGTAPAAVLADVTTTNRGGPPSSGGSGGSGSTRSGTLRQAQQAVVEAQATADADAQRAAAALAEAQQACANSSGTTTTTSSPTTTPTSPTTVPSTSPTTSTTTSTTTVPVAVHPATTLGSGNGSSAACTDALHVALAAQEQVSMAQAAVASAEDALAKLLSTSSTSSGTGSGSGSGSGSGRSSTGSSARSSAAPGSTGRSSSRSGPTASGVGGSSLDSAQQLASDQSTIDSDEAALVDAQQSLADAQLTSPLTGTVASVGITAGQTVSTGSTTEAITVIDPGAFEATASLTSTQAAEAKLGDGTVVTVDDGSTSALSGTVVQIGPVESSDSSYTYPLVVALAPGSHGIAAGSTAQIAVVLHHVGDTLAVPTSAIHMTGSRSYVVVLRRSKEVRQVVTVGVIGALYAQVTSGLKAGTVVVLADLSAAVPSSSNSSASGFGAGRFGGGAAFAAGGGFTRSEPGGLAG
jgi:multidrug efflux pump subunit AcrA (membrane-fusion protein)